MASDEEIEEIAIAWFQSEEGCTLESARRLILQGKNEPHGGDCTKAPYTCPRCVYEDYMRNTRAAYAVFERQRGWRPIDAITDEEKYSGFLLLHSPALIDMDFNPSGVVEGYWQDGEGWIGAIWDGEQDCWDPQVIEPTHYMSFPAPPVPAKMEGE